MNNDCDPCVNEALVGMCPEEKIIPEAITIRLQVDPPEPTETATLEPEESQHGPDLAPLDHEKVLGDQADADNTLLSPTVVRRRDLGRDPSTSQRWRLSMNGTSEVFGSICEAQVEESEPTPTSTKPASLLEPADRRDNTFRVPLLQSVQLASAMFDNGHRVPLALYYVAEELRSRSSTGNLDLKALFPSDWDVNDDEFEAMVTVFDERPFGQGHDLTLATPRHSLNASNEPMNSSKIENLVQSLQMEESVPDSTHSDPSSPSASSPLSSPGISPAVSSSSSSSSSQFSDKEDSLGSDSTSSRNLSRLILRFLHDLPEALVPSDVLSALSNVVQMELLQDGAKTQTMKLLLQALPEEQQHLLQFLLELVDDLIRTVNELNSATVEQSTSEDAPPSPSDPEIGDPVSTSCVDRIYEVLGLVSTQLDSKAMETESTKQSSSSLYRLYKGCIERKISQDKIAAEASNTTTVFQYLVQNRAQIFPRQPQAQQMPGGLDQCDTIEANSKNSQDEVILDNGYQSDSALTEQRKRLQQPKDDGWRMRQHRTGRRRRQGGLPPLITEHHGVLQKTSAETPCDSAVEIRSQDQLALAVLQEHMARTLRSQRHLLHPSMATMHSIIAEGHSDIGDLAVETSSPTDIAQIQEDDEEDERSSKAKKRGEMGFMDFLQEPLDPLHEEREIQLVEKEILQSELTSKFLASNLVGLYPSSSPTPIPAIILPSARNSMLHPNSANDISQQEDSCISGTRRQSRELLLAPQEQIVLPEDHVASDGCTCSYCTTLVQPSKVPVLSKAEYELAELQSQCKSKDQHVTELLKTVQGLQGQVNILNAKLLFLHDHHTTRPMRRRTLARNSYPVQPAINATNHMELDGGSHQSSVVAQDSERLQSSGSAGHRGARLTTSSITTASSSSHASRSPLFFAEGIRLSIECENRLDPSNPPDLLHMLDDDETMSFLDLDDGRPPPPVTKQQRHWSLNGGHPSQSGLIRYNTTGGIGYVPTSNRIPRYESELERALRDVEEVEEEPEREGEDLLDEFYYKDAYKTMDQQLYRRPVLPVAAPPRPMSADQYKKHHRMSLPIQSLMSKRISLRETFRWKGKPAVA
ncbi:hypothetical protein EMPS_03433 [Entomortierella parvispora]|uniref:Rho-GAP domain-containing protein n=1 Tax=Entomortierella parvispora TaxID=205924 RepID=A0A9P3H785_9FUNG|nr:hypothetical protein EMPS_03433 [Entomortierella parvispora]